MTALDPSLVRIDKARLHNARVHDAPRLTRALEQITPAGIGLNPHATLIVRRLALRMPLPRAGPADGFIAELRDDLRARIVSARRGSPRDGEDLFFEDDPALEAAIILEWLELNAASAGRSWIHAIGAGKPLARWRRHILPDQQFLPRVIARLVEAGVVERWFDQFEPSEIRTVATRLLEHYGAVSIPIHAASLQIPELQRTTGSAPESTKPIIDAIAHVAPEARSIVRPDFRRLVALALVIVRRPTLIATSNFFKSFDRFAGTTPTSIAPAITPCWIDPERRFHPIVPTVKVAQPLVTKQQSRPNTPPRFAATASKSATRPSELSTPEPAPPLAAERPTTHSAYAGLFFLVNSFLALRLYGDFTRPADGLKGLSPFELMHRLGTRWFGATFANDPLAPLLIKLTGLEPGEMPGRLFEPPIWRVPDDWLLPWPAAKRKRPGFPLTGKPEATRRHWIDNLARYLSARLKRALDDPDAVAITCTQPGRITLDRDRIIVHFPLADHPIALRFAGLDRDPGWVPAAAHFIGFSFT